MSFLMAKYSAGVTSVNSKQCGIDEHLDEDCLEVLEAPQVAFLVLRPLVEPRPRQHEVLG